jgi:hypothetical protein
VPSAWPIATRRSPLGRAEAQQQGDLTGTENISRPLKISMESSETAPATMMAPRHTNAALSLLRKPCRCSSHVWILGRDATRSVQSLDTESKWELQLAKVRSFTAAP